MTTTIRIATRKRGVTDDQDWSIRRASGSVTAPAGEPASQAPAE